MKINRSTSLNSKTLFYLISFSVLLLVLLWLLQLVNLSYSYQQYQVNNIEVIAQSVTDLTERELLITLENLSFEKQVCIEYDSSSGNTYYFNTKLLGCALNKNNSEIDQAKEDIESSDSDEAGVYIENIEFDAKAYLYGINVDDGYVFVYNTLEDISEVNTIVKSQLIYLTIAAIIISIVVSYFLSKRLTDPISKITKEAKSMGSGKKVDFSKSDIIEINELATTLEDAQIDLLKTDEIRRDLMANVSHDLKTPLTMIKAYAEMIKDISYKDDVKRNEHLDIIVAESDRLNVLVNDLLNLSKLEANVDNVNIENYDIVAEINEVVKRYSIIKETEDYKFILEMPEKAIVKADKNKLNQVIYNLINNAINYTGDDKLVTVKITEAKKNYLVEIIDTGKGIKDEDINRIWDKYYKNDKNHQRNVVSTGIGLSIVKNILIIHNFEYGVRSKKGEGTTFWFKVDSGK